MAERETRPGWWVRAARKACGKSQQGLVDVTGSHRTTVYRWERADSEVDFVTWLGILHALGLPATWEPPAPLEDEPTGPLPPLPVLDDTEH